MTGFEFGDVILVRFPFTDQRTTKQRPAVIISSKAYPRERPDVIIMAVTSRPSAMTSVHEAVIDDWEKAGLLKPSTLKPLIATVERGLVRRRLGCLRDHDLRKLRAVLAAVLG